MNSFTGNLADDIFMQRNKLPILPGFCACFCFAIVLFKGLVKNTAFHKPLRLLADEKKCHEAEATGPRVHLFASNVRMFLL